MKLKTSYERGLVILKNYTRGFKGKVTLSSIRDVNRVMSKLKDELVLIEDAVEKKRENLRSLKGKADVDQSVIDKATEEVNTEFRKLADNVVVETDKVCLEALKNTLQQIGWEENEDKDADTILKLNDLWNEIDKTLTNKE